MFTASRNKMVLPFDIYHCLTFEKGKVA